MMQNNDFVRWVDACSKIAVTVINLANSRQIARLGDWTHDAVRGGFIASTGNLAVAADATSIRALLDMDEGLFPLSPYQIPQLLSFATGQNDMEYLARMLKLSDSDFDQITNGRFVRSFADNTILLPPEYETLDIRDHNGNFLRRDIFFHGAVFTLKCFKFVDRPGKYPFLFAPTAPGIWFRPFGGIREKIHLDPDLLQVKSAQRPYPNAWLNNAGNLAQLDWDFFRKQEVFYTWHADSLQPQEDLCEALRFVAEAKKRRITVSVVRNVAGEEIPFSIHQLCQQAHQYGLAVPEVLRERQFLLTQKTMKNFVPEDIPFFWGKGMCSLFYGPGQWGLFKKLLCLFSGKGDFPRMRQGIIFPESAETRTKKLLQEFQADLLCINAAALHEGDLLERLVWQHKIEAVFVIHAELFPRGELTGLLEFCGKMRVVTGVFSPERYPPADVDGIFFDQCHFSVEDGDTLLIKDMKQKKVARFRFADDDTIAVTPATDEEVNDIMGD